MVVKRTQAERSATTRAALLLAARELFTERGYAAAGREDIAQRAGVTRGALYHHFANKQALFTAVVEDLEAEIGRRLHAAWLTGTDPLDQLRLGCQAFLDAAMDPSVRRIVLLEAPAVLGWQAWRELDARFGLGLVTDALQMVVAAGQIDPQPVEPLAHMLLASLNEAALLVAEADDPVSARGLVGVTIDRLVSRL